jgi:hypothetical protein
MLRFDSGKMVRDLREAGIRDGRRLSVLDDLLAPQLERATHARKSYQDFVRGIATMQENGEIAVVWSGRDCDGVRYAGQVRIVEATSKVVIAHVQRTHANAEGPCSYMLMPPSEAVEVEYTSRDLTMEAFEDGHQHCIYD